MRCLNGSVEGSVVQVHLQVSCEVKRESSMKREFCFPRILDSKGRMGSRDSKLCSVVRLDDVLFFPKKVLPRSSVSEVVLVNSSHSA